MNSNLLSDLAILLTAVFLFPSCDQAKKTSNDSSTATDTNTNTDTDTPTCSVFAGGHGKDYYNYQRPGYWRDGTWVALEALSGAASEVSSIAFLNSDIYAAGYSVTSYDEGINWGSEAVYWKNTEDPVVMAQFGLSDSHHVEGIVFLGSDMHLAGYSDGDGTNRPIYWRNSDPAVQLTRIYAAADVNCLVASGSDLYAGGYNVNEANVGIPGYWKNGEWVGLSTPVANKSGQVFTIVISGTDVYAGGYAVNSDNIDVPGYWFNGTWVSLPSPDSDENSRVLKMAISGSDIYAVGYSTVWSNGHTELATSWKNGALIDLPILDPDRYSRANSIMIYESSVYIGGYSTNSDNLEVAGYWKDWAWIELTAPTTSRSARVNVITSNCL